MDVKTVGRLIIVSNRLPFQLQEKNNKVTLKQSDGGLVTALKSYFENDQGQKNFTKKIWIGSADFPEKRWEKFEQDKVPTASFEIQPLFIEAKAYNKFYNGFCNATLWPLFHYFFTYAVYEEETFEYYTRVNQQFADVLTKTVKPDDTIWVHDYQLFLLPEMIRKVAPDVSIGFFLHIPFPSFEVFRLLHKPWKESILRGMLGADLIGFHTHEYVQHFLKTIRMTLGLDHQYRTLAFGKRVVKVDVFPIGIDYEKFHKAALSREVVDQKNQILKNFGEKKIIFSVDRLDYTKGVTHRLLGFEKFLEQHPEWREKVVFILVVVPSRQIISKYNERRKLIEELVGRINGKYSSLQWQPIIYQYNQLNFNDLCALYQAADIGLITPLRDGMNLVAKEYVASCVEQRGVLILSELAGAANELGEALQVNPMDVSEVADAIAQALIMPVHEQRQKISLMQKRLIDYDVNSWVNDFLTQLEEVKELQWNNKELTVGDESQLGNRYKTANKRLLLLDYDGTLVPFARHPKQASPGEDLLSLLHQLARDEKNQITIISGRDSTVLTEWFGELPINLVAEHGASVKRKDGKWVSKCSLDESWKPNIRPTLELFAKRCPGSFVEEKIHTLAWHYRNVDSEFGFLRSRELLDNLLHLVRNAQLQVIDGNKVIEVRLTGVDKGVAASELVNELKPDFVLVVGDDKTDEDMFTALQHMAFTLKVGTGITNATYTVSEQTKVLQFLKGLTN